MTPAQKVSLDAKQSLQRVEQLASWLDRNRMVVGEPVRGLKESLKTLASRYRTVEQAIDVQPAIAIVGEAGGLRAKLVGALTQSVGAYDEVQGQPSEMELLRRIVVSSTEDGEACAAVRFRSAAPLGTPRDGPIRLALLGIADIAALMVRMHQSVFANVVAPRGLLARLAGAQVEISDKVHIATLPGLSEADVLRLRDVVEWHCPHSAILNQLAAANYWGDLAEVAAHIPDGERVRALSFLWAEQPEVTALFKVLVEGLAEAGYASEVFADTSSVVDRDSRTGWFVAHGDSVISVRTLVRLGEERTSMMRLVGRYGHTSSLPRPVVAALVTEVTLAAPACAIAAHCPADVVDFPLLQLPTDLDVGRVGGDGGLARGQLLEVYAHVKSLYLIERACRHHDLTSLVTCVDPATDATDALPAPIGDWIDIVQGCDPEKRERSRTGLFVIAATGDGEKGRADGEGLDIDGATVDAIAGDGAWPHQWTPGLPFSNIYMLKLDRKPDQTLRNAARVGGTSRGRIADGNRGEMVPGATDRVLGSTSPVPIATAISTRQQAQRLVERIAAVSQPQIKHRQLRRELADLHTRVRARFLRLCGEGEAIERGDWRQRVAAVLDHAIARITRQKKLGLLLETLSIDEAELLAVYDRSDYAALDGRMKVPVRAIVELDHEFSNEAIARETTVPRALSISLAEKAVATWLAAMRRAARSGRLCRQIGLPEALFEHLVDELGLGAARLGLVRRAGEAIEIDVVRARGGRNAYAGSVAAVLNGFLERLEVEGGRRADGDGTGRPAIIGLDDRDSAPYDDIEAGDEQVVFADRWRAALSALVEANIANARYWSVGETSSDLSRILSEFPQSRLEVEL